MSSPTLKITGFGVAYPASLPAVDLEKIAYKYYKPSVGDERGVWAGVHKLGQKATRNRRNMRRVREENGENSHSTASLVKKKAVRNHTSLEGEEGAGSDTVEYQSREEAAERSVVKSRTGRRPYVLASGTQRKEPTPANAIYGAKPGEKADLKQNDDPQPLRKVQRRKPVLVEFGSLLNVLLLETVFPSRTQLDFLATVFKRRTGHFFGGAKDEDYEEESVVSPVLIYPALFRHRGVYGSNP
ncbi:hypothetical protein K438DRAFT_1783400 [Mycena galopus ATCC 62051]|nr:hypothetical protein K438DRAFT_1783400 [Mycena galopus ATCC 62051]